MRIHLTDYPGAARQLAPHRLPGFFIPAFAPLGAFAVLDEGERTPWVGIRADAFVSLFFGLAFGGFRAEWLASFFGPPDKETD